MTASKSPPAAGDKPAPIAGLTWSIICLSIVSASCVCFSLAIASRLLSPSLVNSTGPSRSLLSASAAAGAPLELRLASKPRSCAAQDRLAEILSETFSSGRHPQLNQEQISWIADELYSAGTGKGAPTNLLVFGLGLDSGLWQSVNCLGRTVFLENYQEWMDKVLGAQPQLEAYRVEYNTSVGHADDYYAKGPWSLDVPANVSSDCYDVILVDAPQGYRSDLPGRMQSGQLAMDLARKCVASGRMRKVTIFIHDINRPLEQRIAAEQLTSDEHIYFLGTIKGRMGDLSAFEYSNNIRPQSLFPAGRRRQRKLLQP